MSRILVPSKPAWKITLMVDNHNQVQIAVEDMQQTFIRTMTGSTVVAPRQMNQIELALLLSNTVSSILVNTLNVSKRGKPDASKESDTDGRVS